MGLTLNEYYGFMKKSLFVVFVFLSIFAQAQEPQILGVGAASVDTIPKKIVDIAERRFFYNVIFLEDTLQTNKKIEAQCVLEIGRTGSCFKDFYGLASDSINDAIASNHGSSMELFSKCSGFLQKKKWRKSTLKGYPIGEDYHQEEIPLVGTFEYRCPSPSFQWIIEDDTKVIMGYGCRKATCHYAGRDYTAWYTDAIALSEGPYIFRGLPGLILDIRSDDGEYVFKLNGQQEITFASFLFLKKQVHTKILSRQEARRAIRFAHEHYAEALTNSPFNESPMPADFSFVKPLPYNPLEKE